MLSQIVGNETISGAKHCFNYKELSRKLATIEIGVEWSQAQDHLTHLLGHAS